MRIEYGPNGLVTFHPATEDDFRIIDETIGRCHLGFGMFTTSIHTSNEDELRLFEAVGVPEAIST